MRWNKNILIALLAGGVVFFTASALITLWYQGKEAKKQAAAFALMDLAEKEVRSKNFDGCLEQYEKLYESGGRKVLLRVLALHKMAACQEGKGNFKEACALYERAAKEPGHLAPWFSRYEEARCLAAAAELSAKEHFSGLLNEKNLPPDLREQVEEELLWFQLQKNL